MARIIGPHSSSMTVGLGVLIPLSLGTAFSDAQNRTGIQWGWIVVASQGFAIAITFFAVGGLLVNLLKREPSRAVGFLLLFALTEGVRSVSVTLLAYDAGTISEINWNFRIIAGALTGIAAFSVVSIVVNEIFSFRERLNELLSQRDQLRVLQSRSEFELAAVRSEALRGDRDQANTAIQSLLSASLRQGESATSAQDVVDALIDVSDNVIRPLSHELMVMPRRLPPAPDVASRQRTGAKMLLDFVTRVDPIRPLSLPAMLFLLGFGAAATLIPFGVGIPILAAALTAIGGILWLADRAVSPHLASWSILTRIIVVTLLNAAMGIFSGLSAAVAAGYDREQLWVTIASMAIVFNVVAWVIAVPPGLRQAHREILADTEAINARLSWQVSRDSSILWTEQKQLSRTLHQEVQGTLIAAAFRLQRDLEAGIDPAVSLADIREWITTAVLQSATVEVVPPLHAGLTDIHDRWAGVIDLTWKCDDNLRQAVDADNLTRRIVFDAVGEFITNSIKHGRAAHAVVSLSAPDERSLRLSMTNDGLPLAADAKPGLGTMLAQNVGLAVGFSPRTEGVEFHLDLTLDRPDIAV